MIATHREGGRYSGSTTIALEQLDRWNHLAPLDQNSGSTLAHDGRALVYQVTQDLRPLWRLESAEELEQCYVELLEAHFHAYNRARILHGDISASNAMARRDAKGKVFGLLSDWGLSCLADAHNLGTSSTSRHRTGTAPFMAMDLQRAASKYSVAADHRYCHDLESFFWLLLWAVLHFDLKRKRHRNCTHEDWIGDCRECAARFKRDFMTYGGTWDRVVDDVLDMWQPILKRWVKPLARMIYTARERSTHWNDDNFRVFDDDVYAKELTFEAFMQRIKQTPRDRTHEEKGRYNGERHMAGQRRVFSES
ncbi:uncharacterized protein SCHCODRAFT_02692454 [Schizophyllum commune H4-8]|nr:uncharacterized protein SCHCODRAFT_02692454 [Schizophyllum commune H4-8]KAI5887850.1 hypothetical protein SCHCODRAFT_02692454 [Schizophyllum commune H4-8]